MLPKVAAITMAYNESTLLPVWARHYARQVGADQCYVVDHGSTDPIALPPGMNAIRIPRSAHDDLRRAVFISELAASLLRYYDWVIYTDADELVLADPHFFRDLPSFCAASDSFDTVTAIGFDVQHVPAAEPPLEPGSSIGAQRGWIRFTSAMCKPLLTRQPISWSPGFHCSDRPLRFSQLYLFHLHWADQSLGLRRLQTTRGMPWAGDEFGRHQRVTDGAWLDLFKGMSNLPRTGEIDLDPALSPMRGWLERTVQSSRGRAGQTHSLDLGINAAELWPIPPHFRNRL